MDSCMFIKVDASYRNCERDFYFHIFKVFNAQTVELSLTICCQTRFHYINIIIKISSNKAKEDLPVNILCIYCHA